MIATNMQVKSAIAVVCKSVPTPSHAIYRLPAKDPRSTQMLNSASLPFAARQHDGNKDGVGDEMPNLQGPARTRHRVLISSRSAIGGRPVVEQPPERGYDTKWP